MSEQVPDDGPGTAGIDEALIERLIHTFYARVRADELLGPVFAERIHDWGPHLQRMCAFWSAVALKTRRYQGQPMAMHQPLPVDGRHFDRWLALFRSTAEELCPPEASRIFTDAANRIAESLELGIAIRQGVMLRRGERLRRPDHEVRLPVSEDVR